MQTKLTIRLDSGVISRAKRIAKKRQTSVSRMVSDYFKGVTAVEVKNDHTELPPITRALAGSLKGADIEDYHRYLEKKYL